jgi:hypothetical protein
VNSEEEFRKAAARCWICLNQYEPNICPFYQVKEISSKEEYVQIASNCQNYREPKTPEEILKVL